MADELKAMVDSLHTAWTEFKQANDKALAEAKEHGKASGLATEKVEKLNARLDEIEVKMNRAVAGQAAADGESPEGKARKAAFAKYLRKGDRHLSPEETKALIVGNDPQAGYLVFPQYAQEILKTIVEFSPVRSVARVYPVAGELIIPKKTGNCTAAWASEVGTKTKSYLTVGLEKIPNHELYAYSDVSNQLLEDSAFPLEAFLREDFGEQLGVGEGTAFVTGTGVGQPEGIMTNSSVASVNSGSASAITADGIIDILYALKEGYARNATFMLRRATLGAVRKLKEAVTGQYLWVAGFASQPNTILGQPYIESPDMDLQGSNTYPIVVGDFRRGYIIVDRIDISVLVDPYTSAKNGIVEYIARKRVGGQVVMAEAFKKLKCST